MHHKAFQHTKNRSRRRKGKCEQKYSEKSTWWSRERRAKARRERTHDCLNGFDMFAKRLSKAGYGNGNGNGNGIAHTSTWSRGDEDGNGKLELQLELWLNLKLEQYQPQNMASNHRIWHSQFRFSHSKSCLGCSPSDSLAVSFRFLASSSLLPVGSCESD